MSSNNGEANAQPSSVWLDLHIDPSRSTRDTDRLIRLPMMLAPS